MVRRFGYSLIVASAFILSFSGISTFAAHEKCPKDCKCPQDVKCAKECEEGKTDRCTCRH